MNLWSKPATSRKTKIHRFLFSLFFKNLIIKKKSSRKTKEKHLTNSLVVTRYHNMILREKINVFLTQDIPTYDIVTRVTLQDLTIHIFILDT